MVTKKGIFGLSMIFQIAIVLLFAAAIYFIFFKPDFWKDTSDNIRNFFNTPEVDPLPNQVGSRQDHRRALAVFSSFSEAFEKTGTSLGRVCIAGYPVIEEWFFNSKYEIRITSERSMEGVEGTSLQLFQISRPDMKNERTDMSILIPVSNPVFLPEIKPCLVYGNDEINAFYDDIIVNNIPLVASRYGIQVHEIKINRNKKLSVMPTSSSGNTATNSEELDSDYLKNKYIYLLKYENKVCLFSSHKEEWYRPSYMCRSPSDSDKSLLRACLSSERSIKKERASNSISSKLIAGRLDAHICEGFDFLKERS